MKVLWVLALALAVLAACLFFFLDADGGRGGPRQGAPVPAETVADPTRRVESTPEPLAVLPKEAQPEATRHSVAAGTAPAVRAVFEGTVIGEGVAIPGATLEIVRHGDQVSSSTSDARGNFRIECQPLSSAATLRVTARGFVPTERTLVGRPVGGTVKLGNLRLLRGQHLAGRVVDRSGAGIAGAEVRVEPSNAGGDLLIARGRSGPDGRFEVPDSPPGIVLVSARAKGFGEQSVQYAPGPKPLEVVLGPGAELRLVLLTPQKKPVVGAEVTIQAPNDPRAVKREAVSDAEGRVVFDGLASRIWAVRISHPEYRTNGRGQVQASGIEETIECLPWPAIEGTVRAPGGQPAPSGTRVQALPASAPSDRLAGFEGGEPVRADGTFRIGGLRAGDWRVRVTAPGFAPAVSAPVKLGIEGDGFVGVIELLAGGKVVLALSLDSKPVAGAELELFLSPPSPAQLWAFSTARGTSPGRRVTSDAKGLAVLDDLSAGSVWVAVYADGCPPLKGGPYEVSSQPAPQPIPIELGRGGRLQGRVQAKSGAPVPYAQLRIVERANQLGFPLMLACGEDGRYTSAWLPPGHYNVDAFAPEVPEQRSATMELDLAAGEARTLDLEL